MAEDVIGWDIGGAHVKAARVRSNGVVVAVLQVPCALWRGLVELGAAIDCVIDKLGEAPRHAVTMTGEMVDLFANRDAGVAAIAQTLWGRLPNREMGFYCGGESFVAFAAVPESARRIASANWRAVAQWVARKIDYGMFIDIGSTTTDLIAISGHSPHSIGHDDFTRLCSGELLYSGVVRTPLMALGEYGIFRGEPVPLMAEFFATTADVYRLLDELAQDADQHPAADGAAKTATASARRMARMIGRDFESATIEDWRQMALAFRAVQIARIETALAKVQARTGLNDAAIIVGAGIGQFLVRDIAARAGRVYRSFGDLVECDGVARTDVANLAPAVAVALLLLQR